MKYVLLLALLALCVYPTVAQQIWTNCGNAKDKFTIGTVTVVPDPPVKGQNLTVGITGTYTETVTSGTIKVTVKYGIITLLNKSDPLCGAETGITCPIPQGPWTFKVTELIPSDAPGGSYTGQLTITDQANAELACAKFALKI